MVFMRASCRTDFERLSFQGLQLLALNVGDTRGNQVHVRNGAENGKLTTGVEANGVCEGSFFMS